MTRARAEHGIDRSHEARARDAVPGPARLERRSARGALVASAVCAAALSSLVAAPVEAQLLLTPGAERAEREVELVALREGPRTVITLGARMPPGAREVAWLVPVPSLGDVRSLPVTAFAPIDRVTAPRLLELWEQDPCGLHPVLPTPPASFEPLAPAAPTGSAPQGGASASASARPPAESAPQLTSEPSYAVELLAGSAAEVRAALEARGLGPGEAALATLADELDTGRAKLLLARLRAPALAGGAQLPPLRVEVGGERLTLPTRLIAAEGATRALRVHVVAARDRYEAVGAPNLAAPTNVPVRSEAARAITELHDALLDRILRERPSAVLTERAWRASTCGGCAEPLTIEELAALGFDRLPSAGSALRAEVIVHTGTTSDEPGGPDEMRDALLQCYASALAEQPGVVGTVDLDVDLERETVTPRAPSSAPAALVACATRSVESHHLDRPGLVQLEFRPLSRRAFAELTWTTLRLDPAGHAARDLVLAPAGPIEGGRDEGPREPFERGVYASSGADGFQTRYLVEHAFAGEIACASPRRGAWTSVPQAGARAPDRAPPTTPARTSADRVDALLDGPLPSLDELAIPALPPRAAPPEDDAARVLDAPLAPAAPLAPSAPPAVPAPERRTSWEVVALALAALVGLGVFAHRARKVAGAESPGGDGDQPPK